MNILFICSRNQWRSPTAEALFKNHPDICARSAGTSASARVRVNSKLLEWAELVFVMEYHHKERLREQFRNELRQVQVVVLDIPDDYEYMNPELVEILKLKLSEYLEI